MRQYLWYTLYELAELGANFRTLNTSTTELAKTLKVSQQTVSRHLIELEGAGYITKKASFKGIELEITEKGLEELRRVYLQLKAMIENSPGMLTIEGVVFSGLGEGAYYVSQRGYKAQFQRKLGFVPYPGTLNLKLPPSEIVKKEEVETYPPILVKGFEGRSRVFGDVKCYPTTINGEVEGAAIMIARTHYDTSIIELIAPVKLRDRLNLKDGDTTNLTFFPRKSAQPM